MSTSLNYHLKRDTYRCYDDAELAAISIAMKAVFNSTANNKGSITLTGDAVVDVVVDEENKQRRKEVKYHHTSAKLTRVLLPQP